MSTYRDVGDDCYEALDIPWAELAKITWWDIETLKRRHMDGSLFECGEDLRRILLATTKKHGIAMQRFYLNARFGQVFAEATAEYNDGIYTVKCTILRTEEGLDVASLN